MFWLFFASPFLIVPFSESVATRFFMIGPEGNLRITFFSFLLAFFFFATLLFHTCAYHFGPRAFGSSRVNKAILSVDYVWYFFGGILLSHFAVAELQDRFLTKVEKDYSRIAVSHSTLLAGSFRTMHPACRSFIEISKSDPPFAKRREEFVNFCRRTVAPQEVAYDFKEKCGAALASIKDLTTEELTELHLVRTVRSGRTINELEYLCTYAPYYKAMVEAARQKSLATEELIGENSSLPYAGYILLSLLVALKFTKVSAGIWKIK